MSSPVKLRPLREITNTSPLKLTPTKRKDPRNFISPPEAKIREWEVVLKSDGCGAVLLPPHVQSEGIESLASLIYAFVIKNTDTGERMRYFGSLAASAKDNDFRNRMSGYNGNVRKALNPSKFKAKNKQRKKAGKKPLPKPRAIEKAIATALKPGSGYRVFLSIRAKADDALTQKALKKIEKKFITVFRANVKLFGYNKSDPTKEPCNAVPKKVIPEKAKITNFFKTVKP